MKINKTKFLILIFGILVSSTVLANEDKKEIRNIQFDNYTVAYDKIHEVDTTHSAYFLENKIVLSIFDTDNNNKKDLWLRYGDEGVLNLEVSDLDGDGVIDSVYEVLSDESYKSIKVQEFKVKDILLPENPNKKEKIAIKNTTEKKEKFILNPPPTEKKGFSFPYLQIFLLAIIGGIVYYLKQKKNKKI